MSTTEETIVPGIAAASRWFTKADALRMVAMCRARQEGAGPNNGQMSWECYAAEYCTATFCGPRQSGHTRAALELVAETPGSLYVTGLPAGPPAARLDPDLRDRAMSRVITFNTLMNPDRIRGVSLDLVVVDAASKLSEQARTLVIDRTRECFAAARYRCFLFLG